MSGGNQKRFLLEMVLQSHVEIEGVASVREADSDEGAATCGPQGALTDRHRPRTYTGKLNTPFPHHFHPVSAEQNIGWSR